MHPLTHEEIRNLAVAPHPINLDTPKKRAIREAWFERLEAEGHRECLGLSSGRDNVCAMALLGEIVHGAAYWKRERIHLHQIGEAAGLNKKQVDTIIRLNDSRSLDPTCLVPPRTFAEIARIARAWPFGLQGLS